MQPVSTPAERAVRRAFWLAIVLGSLSILGIAFSPVPAALNAAILFVLAFAIRKGGAGPALALGSFLLVRVAAGAPQVTSATLWPFALASLLPLGIAIFAFWAAWVAWHGPQPRRVVPWMAAVGIYAVYTFLFSGYFMPSAAMAPTLMPGDTLLTQSATWRLGRSPRNGDLLVFRYPPDPRQVFIKRVAGVPGDRLRIEHKQLFRNGVLVPEPYAVHTSSFEDPYRDNFPSPPDTIHFASQQTMLEHVRGGEIVVPPGCYFVLGDNRDDSLDSRYWGFIRRSDIVASPVLVYDSHATENQLNAMRTVRNLRWKRLLRPL